jgi:hypothetical protein
MEHESVLRRDPLDGGAGSSNLDIDLITIALGLSFWENRANKVHKMNRGRSARGRGKMATDQLVAGNGANVDSAMDYPAHLASYHLFTSLMKWGTVFVIGAVLLLAFLTL